MTVCFGKRISPEQAPIALAVAKLKDGVVELQPVGGATLRDVFGTDDTTVDGWSPNDGAAYLDALRARFPRHQAPGAIEAW